ncbi:MAG TPA: hypothetical protein VLG47_04700 [Candidatus Saccharimonadales bacterium]|nr:hypothetical protein [Candidatus Saccharimonadales bacterium]
MQALSPEVDPGCLTDVYHVFAQRRSGQHAIIDWLTRGLENAGVEVGFENDICRRMNGVQRDVKAVLGAMSTAGAAILNYEDIAYGLRDRVPHYYDAHEYAYSAKHHDILIIRDWYNLTASRLFSKMTAMNEGRYVPILDVPQNETSEQWEELAYISLDRFEGPFELINYNEWVRNALYRAKLSTRIGLVDPDTSMSQVASIGRGSSFDGMSYDGSAQNMDVTRRWQYLQADMLPAYRALIADPVISEMNTTIFGFGQGHVLESLPA